MSQGQGDAWWGLLLAALTVVLLLGNLLVFCGGGLTVNFLRKTPAPAGVVVE